MLGQSVMPGYGKRYPHLSSKRPHCRLGSEIVLKLLGDDLFVDVEVRDPVLVHGGRGRRHINMGALLGTTRVMDQVFAPSCFIMLMTKGELLFICFVDPCLGW